MIRLVLLLLIFLLNSCCHSGGLINVNYIAPPGFTEVEYLRAVTPRGDGTYLEVIGEHETPEKVFTELHHYIIMNDINPVTDITFEVTPLSEFIRCWKLSEQLLKAL